MFMRDGRQIVITIDDVKDYYPAARFYEGDPARGPAHWLIVCRVDGVVVTVPIVPAKSGNPAKCRPIGLFATTGEDRLAYEEDERR